MICMQDLHKMNLTMGKQRFSYFPSTWSNIGDCTYFFQVMNCMYGNYFLDGTNNQVVPLLHFYVMGTSWPHFSWNVWSSESVGAVKWQAVFINHLAVSPAPSSYRKSDERLRTGKKDANEESTEEQQSPSQVHSHGVAAHSSFCTLLLFPEPIK